MVYVPTVPTILKYVYICPGPWRDSRISPFHLVSFLGSFPNAPKLSASAFAYLDGLACATQVSDVKKVCLRTIPIDFQQICKHLHVFCVISYCSIIYGAAKGRRTQIGVGSSKSFGVSSVLEMFGE